MRDEEPSSAPTPSVRAWQDLVALADGYGTSAAAVEAQLVRMPADAMAAAIKSEQKISERKRVLSRLSLVASPASLRTLAIAAADAYEQPLSPVLTALLNKLARESEELVFADHSFRDLFKYIVEAWSASSVDSASAGYESMFAEQKEEVSHAGSVAPEPERIVALAFETGATGSVLWTAMAQVTESEDGVRRILGMLKHAPAGSHAAKTIAQQFANPQRLAMLLHEDPVDFDAVDTLIGSMGDAAGAALLDALVDAKTREARRGLLDRLAQIGPAIGPLVVNKLKSDQRWFVQRNMLTVLREAGCSLDTVPLDHLVNHADARVRREATQLQFQNPSERDRALLAALRDNDAAMIKIGLKAARTALPESAVPILAKRVLDPAFPPEFRTSALQLLTRSSSVLALESLLRYVSGGTTLLGKPKLAPKTQEMMIALGGLARSWPNERRAAPLIALARESKDRDIVAAAMPAPKSVTHEKDALDDD